MIILIKVSVCNLRLCRCMMYSEVKTFQSIKLINRSLIKLSGLQLQRSSGEANVYSSGKGV